jgi:Ca2+-binding RTX toxin-like protein
MHDDSRGGDDQLTSHPGSSVNSLYGDARVMDGNSRGGNDVLNGGGGGLGDSLYGDAYEMHDHASGGGDTLIAIGGRSNTLFGDAFSMTDDTRGGNDTLTGSSGFFPATLYGDANTMSGNAQGGNDTLTGVAPAGSDTVLYGDAFSMSDNARGGDDTLISSNGNDHMWGDAAVINGVAASPTAPTGSVKTGADTFVFAPNSGTDTIGDFRQSDGDRIDVSAYGFTSLTNMMITFDGTNTKIAFDSNDSVTLTGFTATLRSSDFVFA